jgi:endonuclease/exonuclease/phosphatase family metal-dependent hydrolase
MKQILSLLLFLAGAAAHALPPFAAPASSLIHPPPVLKVLTFNTWLLDIPIGPFGIRSDVAHDLEERRNILPRFLAETDADIIVLEEVWSQKSKQQIAADMRRLGYPYCAYTHLSSWFPLIELEMGDGLLVLSKFPISKNVQSFSFSQATQRIERFSHKGALKLLIKHPSLGWIDFYASHAGAVDFENGDYQPEQVTIHSQQISELTQWIQKTRSHAISILGADLNMHYQKWMNHQFVPQFSDDYLILTRAACGNETRLQNSYLQTHHQTAREIPDYTFTQSNPYVDHGFYDSLPNEVEDYIFICENPWVKPLASREVFQEPITAERLHQMGFKLDSIPLRLSDHYGVLSTFQIPGFTPEKAPALRLANLSNSP